MISANFLWKILILTVAYNIFDASGDKNFQKCVKGRHLTHKNLAGQVKILICTGTTNGVHKWQYTDGSPTLGEVFNPAASCSDIVDNLPEAEDGFYWISVDNTTKQKTWCDVHTDGGGFTLVGMKDSPVSWTVPSSPTPVDPRGPPHWSSALGNVTLLEFRVQISENKSFKGTKADWLYRLNQEREFGELFSITNGCTYLHGGIGDIKFVKDLMTQTVVTRNFKCSKFGQNVHDMFGWSKMNYCLRHECKNGYAVSSDHNLKIVDKFGSFSYSSVYPLSGINHKSTAFVGCDSNKCCACFGPKGGKQNYCGPKCSAINGGTLMKKAFVWFWVRSKIPERLWKRCMEYSRKNSAGILEKYFIDPRTGIAYKGSCSEHFRAFLREGTLTVSDKESFEKIPDVPGLVSFREDNKQLYVNEGSKWQALSSEQEIEQLRKNQNKKVETLRKELSNQTNKALTAQEYALKTWRSKVKTNEMNTTILRKMVQNLEKKVQEREDIDQTQGNKTQNRIETLEKGYQDVVTRLQRIELQLPKTCTSLRNENPTLPSGTYYMSLENMSFPVHCDMSSKNGVGVTVIGHDSESKIEVNGYESPESYRRKIKYNIDMNQIVEIISRSQKCEQFTKYECLNAGFGFYKPYSCWISRQGWKMRNWGGATSNSRRCACGMSNTCKDPTRLCNCGLNDNVWAEDSGLLTDKKFLPVTELRFGDTSTTWDGNNEIGYHTLGKLLCWG